MGSWGPGNFENDVALDWYLIHFANPVIESLREAMVRPGAAGREGLEPDESEPLLCKIEALTALHKHVHSVLPAKEELSQWKRRYMRVYDDFTSSDACSWDPESIQARRRVAVRTFDAAIRQAESDPLFEGVGVDELEEARERRSVPPRDVVSSRGSAKKRGVAKLKRPRR